jgi:hypothetical protein
MRTKTTLLCAAALAAGVASSMAQSNVYSLNIVGYANVPTKSGYTFESNPFDAAPNNLATNVIPNPGSQGGTYSGPWDASNLQLWTGVGFNVLLFDSETTDTTTGFTTISAVPAPTPTLGSGLGYLINNQQGASNNVTYVGTVRTGTNTIVYPVASHAVAVGSPIPYSGGVSTAIGFTNPNPTQGGSYSGPLDGAYVETANINGSGQVLGYTIALFDSETTDTTTGFTSTTAVPVPEPQIPIGGGFFFVNQAAAPYTFTQILNP